MRHLPAGAGGPAVARAESEDSSAIGGVCVEGAHRVRASPVRPGALEALRIIEDSLAASFPNVAIEEGAEMVIGGKAAISLVCRDTERRIGCRQHVIETPNGVFVLGTYLPLDADPTMALALEDVLSSFRFLTD